MTEYLYILTTVWAVGTASTTANSYDECWYLSDLLWQEEEYWRPEGAGDLRITRCEKTNTLTAVPFPALRSTERKNND